MARRVFFSVSMSLDGFMAPESPEDLMGQQWMELHQWIFPQRFFRANLHLGEGGEEGRDNDIVRATFERTGASVMGKRMFDAGEHAWPEEAPFHMPVFVVTHTTRDPWERPGGTTHLPWRGVPQRAARGLAGVIVLDASFLIAHLDANDIHHERAGALLRDAVDEQLGASPLTLAEVLVGPARAGEVDRGTALLHELDVMRVRLLDDAPARLAVLRAGTHLRLPDCCVLLAAEQTRSSVATLRRSPRRRSGRTRARRANRKLTVSAQED